MVTYGEECNETNEAVITHDLHGFGHIVGGGCVQYAATLVDGYARSDTDTSSNTNSSANADSRNDKSNRSAV